MIHLNIFIATFHSRFGGRQLKADQVDVVDCPVDTSSTKSFAKSNPAVSNSDTLVDSAVTVRFI